MSKIARFGAYAAAFEKAFENDDWSVVEPFFTEDAVYDAGELPHFGGRIEGRDAILAHFKTVLDAFDRRFESRGIELTEGPFEEGDTVRIVGSAIYRSPGVPELVLSLEERATFEGDRIALLEDIYDRAKADEATAYIEAHREKLGIVLPS